MSRHVKTPILTPERANEAMGLLSPRELEVASLVSVGLKNSAIAEIMIINQKSAEVHMHNILDKINWDPKEERRVVLGLLYKIYNKEEINDQKS